MNYEKCCRNCEYAFLESCKGCDTLGNNVYQNFELRKELAQIQNGEIITLPCAAECGVFNVNKSGLRKVVTVYKVEDGAVCISNPYWGFSTK